MKTYEDKYLRDRISAIIQQQKLGKVLVVAYNNGTGLITKDELGDVLARAPYPHDFQVGAYGWLDYERESGMYAFTPRPGSDLPPVLREYKPLQLAEVTINAAARSALIQFQDTRITFTGVPVWEAGYALLKEINEELARQISGVIAWKLIWENEQVDSGLFAGRVPRLTNAHAHVTLSGYALDTADRTLIYFGCVGYKTSIESIRATLITNKPMTLVQSDDVTQTVLPLDHYDHLWQAMPEYTCHHACFVGRTALPGKWEPEDTLAYLLVYHGAHDPRSELQRLLMQRLIEVLEVPVLESWAGVLWENALRCQFITEIETAGDCIAGAKVLLTADWKDLLETLLRENTLQLA